MNAPTTLTVDAEATAPLRTIGLHGRTAVLSAMAGGVGLGGVLVASMTLGGRLSGHALFMNATALFVVGAVIGLVHGLALAYLGRPLGTAPWTAVRQLGRAGLYAVPALAVAWLATIWVAMSLIAAYTPAVGPLVAVVVGWVAAAAILVAAALHGWRALRNAYARWPERRVGTALVAASFAALLVTFLADRPEIWGVRLRVTETGAVLLAAFLAIWVAGPAVTVALRMLRDVPTARRGVGLLEGRLTPTDFAVGLVVGLAVGFLAVPFAGPAVAPAVAGTVVVEVSHALVDEVLLRLFLTTGVAWLLLRWNRVHAPEAAVAAIGVAALTQVTLYTPGALAIGFPTWTRLAAFLTAAVAVPAVAFGTLYWRRGFPTALVADAAALLAIALLA